MSPLINAGSFLINVFFNAFLGLLLLRFIAQLVRVNYDNPLFQLIFRLTNPILKPLRKIFPVIAGIDIALLLLLLGIQMLEIFTLILLRGIELQIDLGFFLGLSMWSTGEILKICIDLYTFGTVILVIFSWIHTQGYNPLLVLLRQIVEPAMTPIRLVIKPISGLDLTPFFFIIGLQLLSYLCVNPLIGYGKIIMLG